jgi:transposase
MTLHSNPIGTIPEETSRVARAAFLKRNLYMQMRDELETFFKDQNFENPFLAMDDLSSVRGD